MRIPRVRSVTFLVSSAVALNCALAARGQEPQQPRYTERVEVARVIVDVRVVDDMGTPVLGLGARLRGED